MKQYTYFAAATLALMTLASCNMDAPITNTGGTNNNGTGLPYTPPTDINTVYELVNDVREKGCYCGTLYFPPVAQLHSQPQIEAAAQKHSIYMQESGSFSHIGRGGSSIGDRLDAEGYHWMAAGENIAMGQTSERQVFIDWLNSPSHCENLMNKNYTEMGLSHVGNYWTLDFGDR